MGWFKKSEKAPEIETETVRRARLPIGSEMAWVSRTGDQIKISYPYAGRVTTETQYFYANDIREIARFVEQTDPTPKAP